MEKIYKDEITSFIGKGKYYEVGIYGADIVITEDTNAFEYTASPSKVKRVVVTQDKVSKVFSVLRSLFGDDAKILAYAYAYSSTPSCKKHGDYIFVEDGDSCISDATSMYIVSVKKKVKFFPEKCGDFNIRN